MTDPYASEEETRALIRKDVRTPAMKQLDAMLEARGASEMGAEAGQILYDIAVELLEEAAVKDLLTTESPDYAYPTIKDYEEIVGFEVNETFKMGWTMARTTNDLFRQMGAQE